MTTQTSNVPSYSVSVVPSLSYTDVNQIETNPQIFVSADDRQHHEVLSIGQSDKSMELAHLSRTPSIKENISSEHQQTKRSSGFRFRISSKIVSTRKREDIRFQHPRVLPSLNKWDPRQPDGPNLLHPVLNPSWLKQIQQKLPWYSTMINAQGGPWLSLRAWDAPYQFIWVEFKIRWQSLGDRWFLFFRIFGVAVMILVFFLFNVVEIGAFYADKNNVETIWDWFHDITNPINRWIHESNTGYSTMMFMAGLFMDILFLWIFLHWMIVGDSMRLPIAYGLLYGVRAIQRFYCILPYASGYIWHHPKIGSVNWPSLSVPYNTGNDFFFSGHVGCGTLAVVEHYYYRNWWGVGYSTFATLYQTFWLLCTRAHYMIDMFTGAIVASWVHILAQYITRPIDQWLSLPPRPIASPKVSDDLSFVNVIPDEEKDKAIFHNENPLTPDTSAKDVSSTRISTDPDSTPNGLEFSPGID